MARTEVHELLEYVTEIGGLTVADLSQLLEKPQTTVWTWWRRGRTPKDYSYDFVKRRLLALKDRANGEYLIKPSVNEHARQAHVLRLKHELFGFSPEDTTR